MLRKFIASQFKRPAGLFGIWSSNLMKKSNKSNYATLLKRLNLQPQDKLLEIGYGPGEGIHLIAGMCETCTVDGIDFSSLMYKRATKYNKTYINKSSVRLQYGDFLKESFADNFYHKIFCLNVIYFWNDLKEPFEKVFSLLMQGGSFHIYMAHKTALIQMKAPDSIFNKYSIEQVVEALKSAGFEDIEYISDKGYYIKAKK
jgi:ubiquinone/menaquinone biosynthesis C-methylase UbiE